MQSFVRAFISFTIVMVIGALLWNEPTHAQPATTPRDATTPATPAVLTPAAKFGALPKFDSLALSKDGSRFAFGIVREDGNFDVAIYEFATERSYRINIGKFKLRGLQFEENGHLLVTISTTIETDALFEVYRIVAVNPEGGSAQNLLLTAATERNYNTGASIVSLLLDEPDVILMSAGEVVQFGVRTHNLYKVNVVTGKVQLVERGGEDTYTWLVDRAGKVLARADHNAARKTAHIKVPNGQQSWRDVLVDSEAGTRPFRLLEMRPNGRILFIRDNKDEFGNIESLNPVDGTITKFLRTDDIELTGFVRDPWTRQLTGASLGGIDPHIRWLDPALTKAQARLDATFPGQTVRIIDSGIEWKQMIVSAASPGSPATYYLYETQEERLRILGEAQPTLSGQVMGAVKSATFKSRDGVDIPVYVTTPPSHPDPKNAPMIMMPHGGPASRDYPEFDYWAQFMASKGYVIVQPQFRGSTGFGRQFKEAGRRQWGKRMQDDVSDAVAWAVSSGLADPKRVCIVGASYGGYAALAGATLTPDLYRCVVSVAGVSDLERMLVDEGRPSRGLASSSLNYWRDHIGADDFAAMRAVSPRRLAQNVRAPVLLLHGQDDSVVLVRQSKDMENALKSDGKTVRYVGMKGEDHWLSRAATRIQVLEAIDTFLAEHLGPGLPIR
jgi:dipeptidyl aminopeptidase/acylaminoacyl peptidase